jgi:F-box protein 9
MSDELNPELESFRQQWRAEVTAKTKGESSTARTQPARPAPRTPSIVPKTIAQKLGEDRNDDQISDEEDGDISTRPRGRSFHAASSADEEDVDSVAKMATREPLSALEHYEKAVERETEGNLGDSLKLYRKAFRVSISAAVAVILAMSLTTFPDG